MYFVDFLRRTVAYSCLNLLHVNLVASLAIKPQHLYNYLFLLYYCLCIFKQMKKTPFSPFFKIRIKVIISISSHACRHTYFLNSQFTQKCKYIINHEFVNKFMSMLKLCVALIALSFDNNYLNTFECTLY